MSTSLEKTRRRERISQSLPFQVVMVVISAAVYSAGFNMFVHSANLFPGGYAGLSRLLSAVLREFAGIKLSFSIIYFCLNVVTTLAVWRHIGHRFILLSFLFYSLTSLFTGFFPKIVITEDELLMAVFGGLINGFAIGISLRNNASSGGTDFIAIDLSMRYNVPTWNYILAGNAVVLFIAGLLFGWNRALYSIIFQFVSTQIVNTMHQRYKLTRVDVVTNLPDEVCQAVFHSFRHGITKIRCEGGFTDKDHWLLLITVNTYELRSLIAIIRDVDPKAFMTINSVGRIVGNYYQKPLE